LTTIAYAANYFDQAHMTKEFKSITGKSPKDFFKNLTTMEQGQINWSFV
jgi:AraC-like DNA-binding protein